jgi:hypothetical protein
VKTISRELADLTEGVWAGVQWIHLVQVNDKWSSCEHGNVPSGFIKDVEFLE